MSDLHEDTLRRLRAAGEGPDPGPAPIIRLQGEETVTVPLWHHVLLFGSATDLAAFGAPPELAADVEAWGRDWQHPDTYARTDMTTRAHDLVERLTTAFGGRYEFVYQPGGEGEQLS